jgi:cell division protein FtsB
VYVNPVIQPSGPMTDLDGNLIQDATGHIGFPGFDGMEATVSLAWVAQMQEAGIPVTYAYVSDAHDGHGTSGNIHFAFGPGESAYTAQLQAYDQAFGKFFDRLAADGIDKSNTLFIFTVDEGDHFVGDSPTPPNCDGVTTPCTYNRVGEINADLRRMVFTQFGDSTLFSVHSDDAPTVYVNGTSTLPIRDQSDPVVRNLEREMGHLNWLNPYTGVVENNIMVALADHTEMKTLHMITADPFRTPTFTPFADPNWFFFATPGATPATCTTPDVCAFIPARGPQSFAWNHGDIQDEIASTWVGYVGGGVQNLDTDGDTWSDHTDVRPTILNLVGLKDDYVHDGRVISEILDSSARPSAVQKSTSFTSLAQVYKQLNAPFGAFAMATLRASTKALASNAPDDATYKSIDKQIRSLTARRDALAAEMKRLLNGAEFDGKAFSNAKAFPLIVRGFVLLNLASALPH